MLIPVILATISPFIWGTMNVLDKYVIAFRVKNTLSYASIIGIIHIIIGTIIVALLSWTNVTITDLIYPAIAGIIFGLEAYLYFTILETEDISHTMGFIFSFPILLAILSYIFLKETLTMTGYAGMIITIIGVLLLSIRFKHTKQTSWKLLILLIATIALIEFFIKLSTTKLTELQGIGIYSLTLGLTLAPLLFNKKIRTGLNAEIKNIKLAILSETMTILGMVCLFYSMAKLPVTLVASIGATQPLIVLFIERIVQHYKGNIAKEHLLMPKLIPITIIVIGVILIYTQL